MDMASQFDQLNSATEYTDFNTGSSLGGGYSTPSNTPTTTPNINTPKSNSYSGAVTSSAIGAGAEIGSAVIQGIATSKENEALRAEARELANIQRGDILNQQGINNKNKAEAQRQMEVAFQQEKRAKSLIKRFEAWKMDFEQQINRIKKAQELSTHLNAVADQNEQLKNIMISNFGR